MNIFRWDVKCPTCGIFHVSYTSKEDAESKWNTRAGGQTPTPPETESVKALASATGSESPDFNACPGCNESGLPMDGGFKCANAFCDVRTFRSRTQGVHPVNPNDQALPQAGRKETL